MNGGADLVLLRGVRVPRGEVAVQVSRASGPGGQHVNRTESRVTLRFCLRDSPSIPEEERARMLGKLESRLTRTGEVLVSSEKYRDQLRNREEAFRVLEQLLRSAMERPRSRRPSRPTRASVQRRLDEKRLRGTRKQGRQKPGGED